MFQNKYHKILIIKFLLLYSIFLTAEYLSFGKMKESVFIAYIFFTVLILTLQEFVLVNTRGRLRLFLDLKITLISLILPLGSIIYSCVFNARLNNEVYFAILQSNLGESKEFIADFIPLYWYFFLFLSLSLVIACHIAKCKFHIPSKLKSRRFLFLASLFGSIFMFYRIRVINSPIFSYMTYQEELARFRAVKSLRDKIQKNFLSSKAHQDEIHIVVIGESHNKLNMSLYGYNRPTNPELSKIRDELIIYKNSFSNHTHTMPTLSMALTESNQLNQKKYYESLSLIDILNAANIETYWLTNQSLKSKNDNLVSVIAFQAKELIAINNSVGGFDTQNPDGFLLNYLDDIFSRPSNGSKVIFLHLMGSHGDYCKRYPEDFKIFTGSKNWKLDCYDNSVRYNDFVLSSLLAKIKTLNKVSSLIYFSDHADDVLGGNAHNSAKFTYEMTQIPLFSGYLISTSSVIL